MYANANVVRRTNRVSRVRPPRNRYGVPRLSLLLLTAGAIVFFRVRRDKAAAV